MIKVRQLIESFGNNFLVEGEWSLAQAEAVSGKEILTLEKVGYIGQDPTCPSIPQYAVTGTIDGLPIEGVWYNEMAFEAACKAMGL